jgi:PknH-like extracellular domain
MKAGGNSFPARGQSSEKVEDRWQDLRTGQQRLTHSLTQAVVLFPSAPAAAAFVSAWTHSWSACAIRGFTDTSNSGRVNQWTVGPVSLPNGTLSAARFQQNANGWTCQRALTAANNVVIDLMACSYSLTNQGVIMADQIAAKVPK